MTHIRQPEAHAGLLAPTSTNLASATPGEGADRRFERPVDIVVDGLCGDICDLRAEVLQLRQALATRASIEQAKGILMAHYGIGADVAFRLLVRWSQTSNVKLRVIAGCLVDVVDRGAVLPTSSSLVLDMVLTAAASGSHLS